MACNLTFTTFDDENVHVCVNRAPARARLRYTFLATLISIFCPVLSSLHALPFNDDMFHDQYKTGEVMRANPKGSIPLGVSSRWIESKDEAMKLTNPIAGDKDSIARGERLWGMQCTPCHGNWTGSGFKRAIPMTTGLPIGPDVSVEAYAERPDGLFFATIYFGGLAIMPRYSWKLSITEHWDIVNYIRKTQRLRKEAEGK